MLRFRKHPSPVAAIDTYLAGILAEARRRGYRFDARKVGGRRTAVRIAVARGQVRYEWSHLRRKLKVRAPLAHRATRDGGPTTHPLFRVIPGPVASWEKR